MGNPHTSSHRKESYPISLSGQGFNNKGGVQRSFDNSEASTAVLGTARSKRRGWRCVVLPGISSLDTLCIDLNIDYGEGLQVHEASDLVENEQLLNPHIHTLIFQIAEFNCYTTSDTPSTEVGRFKPIERYLMKYFPADQPIIIAFSDDGDGSGAFLLKSRLRKLDSLRRRIFLGTTLYIPPVS